MRLLGLVYLAAFGSFWPQILGLIGSHGIVPAAETLSSLRADYGIRAFFYLPSVFWFSSTDSVLTAVCVLGCLSALLLLCGLFSRVAAALCFVLYLSLVTAGQPFSNFQWDALLLEAGFLALFAGAPWLLWAYRFLLFRLMFESGVVKLASHDPNWRNLNALNFHFFTQPLPTPLAYYFHRAPTWLLQSLTAATLAIELLVPFLIFFPRKARYAGGALLIGLQFVILLTGNYAFFNLLTLSLCLWAFDDSIFAPIAAFLRRRYPVNLILTKPLARRLLNGVLGLLIVMGTAQIGDMLLPDFFRPIRGAFALLEPFEVVNRYGLFAVMTTSRPEIVLEGSDDNVNWKEYSFRYKPGNLHRNLPLVAPYQPRLDWQMWFAALGNYRENTWVGGLVYRLLLGDASVGNLLEKPLPFAAPPKYIRTLLYDYAFTTPAERHASGAIWKRQLLGTWLGPVSLVRNEGKK